MQWTQEPGRRWAGVLPKEPGKVGFHRLEPQQTGINFTNLIPFERHSTNQILLNGSGVAAGDVDGDGWGDLFFCGIGGRSALYRNLGDWKFQNVTGDAGLAACAKLDATGAALVDLDGDGDLDLLVNSVGQGTFCFWNDGRGHFGSSPLVLNPGRCGNSLALGDIDGNGTLDLYIANYRTSTIRDQPAAGFTIKTMDGQPHVVAFGGHPLTDPDLTNRFAFRYKPGAGGGGQVLHDELGEPDLLYRNIGDGRFEAVPFTSGMFLDEQGKPLSETPLDWGLSVMIRDFNGDGAPDIYVCNDFATPDRFWINDRHGHFRAASPSTLRQTSLSTMAIDVADINRDGFDEIFTVDMLSRQRWRRLVQRNEPNPNMPFFFDVARQPQSPRNVLQLARGDGTYTEVAQLAGVEAAEWAWASIFVDVDLDGYEDLLVANGFERDYMNMDANRKIMSLKARGGRQMPLAEQLKLNRLYPRLATANAAFRNVSMSRGEGARFEDVSTLWGFDQAAVSQGMCLADLDNDGDLDVIINNCNEPAILLRNETVAPRVAIRLKGKAPNTRGIGAKIKLLNGAVPIQSQEMIAGGRYLSSDDAIRVFAAGSATNQMTLEVTWRSGARSSISNLAANRIYEIEESASSTILNNSRITPTPVPMFNDVSSVLGHSHTQEAFDDFARQRALPNRLSTLGPGASWFDVDGDGWDDLLIAGARGGKMAAFRNDQHGGFTPLLLPALDQTLTRSQTTVLGFKTQDGQGALLAGCSNYEDGLTNGSIALEYVIRKGERNAPTSVHLQPEKLPGSIAITGPIALADVDGDGELDLFVGGRCVPGRWPEAAPSLIFRGSPAKWSLDQENTKRLSQIGLVSGAVFTDVDGDGDSDLVLACEWGPVRVFRNEHGLLTDATADLGLDKFTGWWNGVTAGDFDGDGRMDLIASNWGTNTKYERFRGSGHQHPIRIFYGDFNSDGSVALMEGCFDETLRGYAPILNVWTISQSMPWLLEKFNNYEAFSRATVEAALGDRGRKAKYLEAVWLESTVFLNRGGKFEARPLPFDAQTTPGFALCVADFDGDGNEDVFLSQNCFDTRAETSRYDSGRGLLLRGDGRGSFLAVPGQQSGLQIYGQQRGAAAADYDHDGRTDLVVTQVGDQTKLFHNETAAPGLRVRLQGPPGNKLGIGAVVRLQFANGLGAAREIHAGSGYWSQDSATQVTTTTLAKDTATGIQVRWPGGKVVESKLPTNAREISIDTNGTIETLR